MLRIPPALAALLVSLSIALPAIAQDAPHHREARQIFERLIAFRSAAGHGQVVPMARYIADTLRAGGVPAADITEIPLDDVVALLVRLPGSDASARPLLFSAHMDVVDARPEDWARDPFTLIEEKGMFYGRGTSDNKAGVAAMMSTILRFTSEARTPRRTLVFAFIGDEETTMDTTSLVAAHEWVRQAEFAINTDAGGGVLDDQGRALSYMVQGAEKTYADFTLVATNQGGHSSWPRDDNAIYDLARAIARLEQHRFPVMANELTRAYFKTISGVIGGAEGNALRRFAENPQDQEAAETLRTMPEHIGKTRTTCIPTLLEAGHAPNALPQKATANVNCRIFPGHSLEEVHQGLIDAIGNPAIAVETPTDVRVSSPSASRADVTEAITASIHRFHPGIPITPYLESGATDGLIYRNAGIPTFASSGIFMKASDAFAHGLNERIPVAGFYQGIDHIHDLAVALGGGK
jgi:carboxypeptidase PM20D1